MSNRISSVPARSNVALLNRHAGRLTATDELAIKPLGNDYVVDGSGTATRLPIMPKGTSVWLHMAGTPTFTNSAKLICPSNQNYTAVAGDLVIARSKGDGIWQLYVLSSSSGLLAANNLSDVANPATAAANLGALRAANNLSEVVAATARTNLGLGNVNNVAQVATVKKQIFTASGTYTPSTGMLYGIIEDWGAGGGAGGVTGVASAYSASGGGGAGSKSIKYFTAADIGASKPVTIGAGGAGGTGSISGVAGGDTSVGSLCIAKGGAGGSYSNGSAILPAGGSGGVAGTGDGPPGTGQPGGHGTYGPQSFYFPSGCGGSTEIGGGGASVSTTTFANGLAGTGFGAVGSGAAVNNSGSALSGGAGTAGFVRITEFCSQ